MSKASDKLIERNIQNNRIDKAMVLGVVSAKGMGLEKPYDIAVSITVALKDAGFQITKIPQK